MPTLKVKLAPTLARFVERRVEEGDYLEVEDVVADALRRMSEEHRVHDEAVRERLRARISEGYRQARNGEHTPYSMEKILKAAEERVHGKA